MRKVLLACLWLPLHGCISQAPAELPPSEPPIPEVGVITLQLQPAVLHSELAGRTSAWRVSEVRPQVSGVIQRQLFEEGAEVQAGQVLYQLEPARYQAAYEQAQANLAHAKASVASLRNKAERYRELRKLNSVSQQDYEQAQAEYQQGLAAAQAAQAALKAADVELQYTQIRAPIWGRIGRSSVTEGALVTAEQSLALAIIQQLDPIYVDLIQSSQARIALKRQLTATAMPSSGAPVTLKLEDGSYYSSAGVLKFAEVNVDAQTGSVTLRAQFPNPEGLLLPGMYVRAEVAHSQPSAALLVPQQAVSYDAQGHASALIVDAQQRVEQRQLNILGRVGQQWWVSEGLQPGEPLIIQGKHMISPGQTVKPIAVESGALEG